MATEAEVNLAREQNADSLRTMGAHAITIDEIKRKGEKTFAVVALFEQKPDKVPTTLTAKNGDKTVTVPLVARVAEKFYPE